MDGPERLNPQSGGAVTRARRRPLPLLPAVLLVAAGIAISLVSSFSVATTVATEVFQGTAPPGLGLLGLNVTDHGFARFTSSLPCPLIIYPLSEAEYQAYTDSGSLPPQALHCDNPSVVKGQPVSYLLIRNVGPEESLDYTVEGEFLRAIRPYHWMAIPGLILLVGGAIPLLVMFLMRGILQLGKSLEEDSEQNKGLKK